MLMINKTFYLGFLLLLNATNIRGQQNICNISQLPANLQTGLVAFYPFCNNANDVTSNANNGIVNNAMLANNRFGNANSAYNFDCLDCYIDVNTAFFYPNWSAYSISCWTKSSNLNVDRQVFFNTRPHHALSLGIREPNQDYFGFGISADGFNWDVIYDMVNSPAPNLTNWFHHVLVKNGNTFKYYVNNVLVHTEVVNNAFTVPSPSKLRFGAIELFGSSSYVDYQFHGLADDYMIYNRALSTQEVQQIYTQSYSTVALDENEPKELNIEIYPNPSNGAVNIYCNNNATNLNIEIYNSIGQKVETNFSMVSQNQINTELSPGFYFISIHDKFNAQSLKKTIIIN